MALTLPLVATGKPIHPSSDPQDSFIALQKRAGTCDRILIVLKRASVESPEAAGWSSDRVWVGGGGTDRWTHLESASFFIVPVCLMSEF